MNATWPQKMTASDAIDFTHEWPFAFAFFLDLCLTLLVILTYHNIISSSVTLYKLQTRVWKVWPKCRALCRRSSATNMRSRAESCVGFVSDLNQH